MTRRVRRKLATGVLLYLLAQTISATDELVPDIELLAFLGTIAGLENMGVEIDELLAGPATDAENAADTDSEASEGENNE